ncbi:MAG TPA: hypothetical protein VMM92_05530, partial [Thermoanaerobaculia bacterium]|nr:hypothetical protein [Thermoanaerobaculia bacterium]
ESMVEAIKSLDTIKPFLGTWYIKWVTGEAPRVQANWQLLIGTGKRGALKPRLDDECYVCVGFAILDEKGKKVLSSEDGDRAPLLLLFNHGTLRGFGFVDGRAVRVYISMSEAYLVDGSVVPNLYATTLWGDPDQVGVWGADGTPPPEPC